MAKSPSKKNPFQQTAWGKFRHWFRTFPRWVLATAAVLFVSLIVLAGWVLVERIQKNRRLGTINEQWDRFDKVARSGGDEKELRDAIDGVLRIDPDNDRALRYLRALETGVADEVDTGMCYLSMIIHLRKGQLPESSREARKRLSAEPNDWLARCIVAHVAFALGARGECDASLDLLPDPNKHPPTPMALLMANDLFIKTGRSAEPLRKFVANYLVDMLGSVAIEKYGAGVKIQLLECYLVGFQTGKDAKQESRLSVGVTPALKLADQAFQNIVEEKDAGQAVRLGSVCSRLTDAFALLVRDKQMTAEQYNGIAREHDDRIGKVWKSALALDPKQPAAYQGMALWHSRGGRFGDAREVTVTGLKECGDNNQLLALYSYLLIRDDKASDAAEVLLEAAKKEPDNLVLWLLTAETAVAANRRDIALSACRQARRLAPNHPLALRTEAAVHIAAGNSDESVQLLSQLGEPALVAEPRLAKAYVRSLIEAGLDVAAPKFLSAVEAEAFKSGSPQIAAAALSGLFESRYDPQLSTTASDMIRRLMTRWPTDIDLLTIKALLLEQEAENRNPPWETDRVNTAISALKRVLSSQSDNRDAIALLAWVQLKGAKNPAEALSDVAKLADAAEKNEPLPSGHLSILGAVLLANQKTERAIQVLVQANKSPSATASSAIHLALAYHAQGRLEFAKESLDDARKRPMSAQDRSDFKAAQAAILREKP